MHDSKLDILFEPLKMSNLRLKNRFFMAPIGTGFHVNRMTDFLVARPEGFAIVLQGDAGRLLVGKDDFHERLERFLSARDHLPAGVEIDLRFSERVTYRSVQKELP